MELLLSVPWESQGGIAGVPAFARGLRLPEYDYQVIKTHPEGTAFFSPFWIADARGSAKPPLSTAAFYRTPEDLFYGRPIGSLRPLPNIQAMLAKHGFLVIESQRLLRHPEFHSRSEFLKGVCIRLVDNETVEVCELTVDYPSSQIAGYGLSMGWYYTIDSSQTWSRHLHPDECPCQNTLLHQHHMWIVAHFEELLADGKYAQKSELDYIHPETAAH